MNAIKTHTLSIKTGEYVHEGKTKNKYLYVGAVMKNIDTSSFFLLLDKTFNPAGIVDDRENVLISMLPVKKDDPHSEPDSLVKLSKIMELEDDNDDDDDVPF